ncbi:MAG TPA: immunoglobulin domain-containing protein [Candidatus Angelobacter sp.]|nr:immunoglobulin domain-containing protein [Candidatus Angelobacter sp.]
MKKCITRGFALVAIAGSVLAVRAQDATDETQYPTILQQPVDQCVPVGSTVTFSVVATNADTYQWYLNNASLDGQTNSSVTIPNVSTNSVGYYSATVINDLGGVPTRMACLNVYITSGSTSSGTTSSGTTSTKMMSASMAVSPMDDLGSGGVITVFGPPVVSGGSGTSCPGSYSGYVNYLKPMTNGWGFAPDTNASYYAATDQNRSDTKVQGVGYYGDIYCATNTITIPHPAVSPTYRFTIYFPKGVQVPTNSYPITLTGFDP